MANIIIGAVSNSACRAAWWKRIFRSLGTVAGLFTAGLGAETSSAAAQNSDYRSATAAPSAWQEFAKQLQSRFQQRLAADDATARKFQDYLAKHAGGKGATPRTLVVRTWILPDGKMERVEFEGLDDAAVAVDLRAVLIGGDVGAPPPPDMLQPLRLRLSLRPNDEPRRGE